jgi:NADH-quinone oxidoreductase subunit J
MPSDGSLVTTQQISDQIFGPYLLPFWALSFVLLAAVIGAIVLARKD